MNISKTKLKEHVDMWKSTADSLMYMEGPEFNQAVTIAAILNAIYESLDEDS